MISHFYSSFCADIISLPAPWEKGHGECFFDALFCNRREVDAQETEAFCRRCHSQLPSVLCCKDFFYVPDRKDPHPCIDKAACDVPYHVIEEAFACHIDADEIFVFFDADFMDVPDRI